MRLFLRQKGGKFIMAADHTAVHIVRAMRLLTMHLVFDVLCTCFMSELDICCGIVHPAPGQGQL